VQAGAQDYLVKGQMDGPLLARTLSYAIERNRLQQEIRALSLMDELTGLYNRRGFMTLAQQQIESANRSGALLLILFVDLDDMKRINDTLGHAAGDAALRETASLLRQTFRGSDILARIGGDEFAVMAMDMHGGHAERLAERLTRAVAERNRQADLAFQLSLSLGVTCYNPAAPRTLQELIDHADALMYQHKRARKEGRAPAVAHLF
jgi:diguanylate cyclase (GGDEF)-like protein